MPELTSMATRASVTPVGKGDVPTLNLGNLVLDAVLVKERHFFIVQFEAVDEPGHDDA
jgi:hypothetical protein